jgi:hypothetical protein
MRRYVGAAMVCADLFMFKSGILVGFDPALRYANAGYGSLRRALGGV